MWYPVICCTNLLSEADRVDVNNPTSEVYLRWFKEMEAIRDWIKIMVKFFNPYNRALSPNEFIKEQGNQINATRAV